MAPEMRSPSRRTIDWMRPQEAQAPLKIERKSDGKTTIISLIGRIRSEDLDELKSEAEQAGDIAEVRVIAWADKEYPPEQQKRYTKDDIKLADQRADKVRTYLREQLKLKSITTFNMAKRPNLFQEMLKTPTAAIKDTLEKSGAAPHSEKDTGLFAERSKSSTALVLVFKKSMKDNKLIR